MVPIGVSGVAFVSYGFTMVVVVVVVTVVVDIECDSAIVEEALGVAVISPELAGCILLMATSEQKAMPTTRRLRGNSMIRNGLRQSNLIFNYVQERR